MALFHSLLTLAAFGSFVGILWWAYAPSRKAEWTRNGELGDDA